MGLKSLLLGTVSLVSMSAAAQFEDKLIPEVPINVGIEYRGGIGLAYTEKPVQLAVGITALPPIAYNYFNTRGWVGVLNAGVNVPVALNAENELNRYSGSEFKNSIGEKQVNAHVAVGLGYRRDCLEEVSLWTVSLKQNFMKVAGSDKIQMIPGIEIGMTREMPKWGFNVAAGIEKSGLESRPNWVQDAPWSKASVGFTVRANIHFNL